MAANTKGKRKVKGKTLDLNTFLGEDQDAPTGYAVIQPRRFDWADTMENEDLDDRYTLDYKKEEKVVLPTAPKAARGPDVDMSKIPTSPPFTAFLGNLPYDVSEDDISSFFKRLEVKNIRLPRENGDRGRIRGFGYAEFNSQNDLMQALSLTGETLKNRAIKVSVAGEHDGDRNDRRDGGVDRTLGDWRSDKRDQFSRDDSRNDSFQSRSGYGDRDSYRNRSNYDRPFERNNDRFDRNDRFERNGDRFDRNDFGSRNDRDYGRNEDRGFERRNDRGYGFSDRGMSRGGGGRNDRRDGFRDNYGRRDDRDSRFRDSSDRDIPPRDNVDRQYDRPSNDSGVPKERRKLQLAPRTKPIEPVPPPSEAITKSSIFGGAKPVDTAAREREIEERLAREKEVVVPKERDGDRVRKFSSGSGMSNRSRRSSDSGPPGSAREDEDSVPQYKPPLPKQQVEREREQPYNTLPRTRQRCGSTSSTGSDRENVKANPPSNSRKGFKNKNYNSNYNARSDNSDDAAPRSSNDRSSYSEPAKGGFRSVRHNHSYRDNSRDRIHGTTYEEPKPPVYTSANKFSHLMNDAEDLDRGSNSE
ncbi:eukaryotic translation initiation factor 4B-like isoform X1 [Argiope bruennichi]|uniref:Eukaryotic translation initiation factor 4B like protein n=1 Tax=Argiope bruennichi TaxID=94029 RepID=A0A8T0FXZ6_ARGBR|nr:eukaryotic translation initiation factor 4B-like isoform X1 [Argiope bruennichi]KAF8795135.1 Eukaryotic translation initiation factor 4B like protein [Argiope bruennichi]